MKKEKIDLILNIPSADLDDVDLLTWIENLPIPLVEKIKIATLFGLEINFSSTSD